MNLLESVVCPIKGNLRSGNDQFQRHIAEAARNSHYSAAHDSAVSHSVTQLREPQARGKRAEKIEGSHRHAGLISCKRR